MDIYRRIKTKEHYDRLLGSGMFWEFHPELTGVWSKDSLVILSDGANEELNQTKSENSNLAEPILVDGSFKELADWILENRQSVFISADIPKESKRKILNALGYSSNSLDD